MAHEIEEHDGLVLHRQAAWHGLGIIVEDAPTPREALKIAGLGWEVVQYPLLAVTGPTTGVNIPSHQANFRSDTKTLLGVVGKGYTPIQNTELADFCEALAEQGDTVKVESAGSIRNGQKVWFLLKGESFSVRGKDEVCPYYCASNGHDGTAAFRLTPTTVRVVCSNTLHMVIPQKEGGKLNKVSPASFVAHHTTSIKERVEEAKVALQLYGRALDKTREVIDTLAAKDVTSDMIKEFFLKCYTHDFGPIPVNPKDHKEKNKEWQAMEAFNMVGKRFDTERGLAGATLWNAMNAYTGWLMNDRPTITRDEHKAHDAAISSKLFGTDADRAHHALTVALMLAG